MTDATDSEQRITHIVEAAAHAAATAAATAAASAAANVASAHASEYAVMMDRMDRVLKWIETAPCNQHAQQLGAIAIQVKGLSNGMASAGMTFWRIAGAILVGVVLSYLTHFLPAKP